MKRICSIAIMFLVSAGFAAAQIGAAPATDVLGAHLNYGRGCAACHAPHSGAYGNGAAKTTDPTAGQSILWGQDVESLYGQTITLAGNTVETLPVAMSATTPDVNGLLTCLSCHDGNYAKGAMMKNQIYETLPPTYGTYNTVPTLIGINEAGAGTYLADHPVGLNREGRRNPGSHGPVHHLPQPALDECGQGNERRNVGLADGFLRDHVLHSRTL